MKKTIKHLYIVMISSLVLGVSLLVCGFCHTQSISTPKELSSPTNISLTLNAYYSSEIKKWKGEHVLTWDKVENAESYRITLVSEKGKASFHTTELCYTFQELKVAEIKEIQITAIGNKTTYTNSPSITVQEELKQMTDTLIFKFIYEDGTYKVERDVNQNVSGELVLPDTCKGKAITQIGIVGSAWLDCIEIPKTVTTIENYAFRSTAITELRIPKTVTSIGRGIACGSQTGTNLPPSRLTKITVEEGNTVCKSIDGNLYSIDGKVLLQYACGKTEEEFVVPEGVERIGEYAFHGARKIKRIIFPKSITAIEMGAVVDCQSLEYVYLPEKRIEMDRTSFGNTPSLKILHLFPENHTSLNPNTARCVEFLEGCTVIRAKIYDRCAIIPKSAKVIYAIFSAVFGMSESAIAYYKGSAEEWAEITFPLEMGIGTKTLYLYFYSETEPTEEGNYWHYADDGTPVVWEI